MKIPRFALFAALFLGICRPALPAQTPTTGTALVRHAPTITGTVEGSMQQMLGENVTLNGGSIVSNDLFVPGTPNLLLSGRPTFGGSMIGSGPTTPTGYTVTLNGNARLGGLVTRTNAVALAGVPAPLQPTGTRSVIVNSPGQGVGLWPTLRNLTLNGNVGEYVVPPGNYGDFTSNAGSGFTLGIAGTTQPSIYHFQNLILNGQCRINVVGPVIVTVANSVLHNGRAGTYANPQWLELRVASGGLTVNGNSAFYGYVLAPGGTITIAGRGELSGGVECDRLIVNGGGLLRLWKREGGGANQPPIAHAQNVELNEDTPTPIGLSATDPDNGTLGYTITTPPQHGSLSGSAPNLTYTPALNYHGPDSFAFTASDGATTSNPATISITILPVNDPPDAQPQAVTVSEDSHVDIELTGVDLEGASVTYSVVAGPQHGTISGTAPAITYTPAADFTGEDSFTFKVNDGDLDSAEVAVSIHVGAIPDLPTAFPLTLEVLEDHVGAITLSGTDGDGDVLTFEVVVNPGQGSLGGISPELNYTPDPDYYGADFFTYTAGDGAHNSAAASVEITVIPVNDAPEAVPQPIATDEDFPVEIVLSGTDVDLDNLTYRVVDPPQNGSLSGTAPNLTYTPYADYQGPDGFTFVANDATVDSVPAAISIVVRPINDFPIALPLTVTTMEEQAVTFVLPATDVDGDGLAFEIVAFPSRGTAIATINSLPEVIYTPNANVNGPDQMTFRVFDGSVWSEPATVTIQVEAINDPPAVIAGADQTITAPVAIGLSGNVMDDGDALPLGITWSKVSGPGDVLFMNSHAAETTASYTRAGVYVLRLTADDGEFEASDDLEVTIIRPNQAPVVDAGTDQRLAWNVPASLEGTAQDDGLPEGVTLATIWTKLSGPGVVTFADAASFATSATFSAPGDYVLRLRVSDSEFASTDTLKVIVVAPNHAPVVNVGSDRTAQFGASVTFAAEVNDDGLPAGLGLETVWTKVSGPGAVTFDDPYNAETTVAFSQPGSYVLRLTADDGEMTGSDEVTVAINLPPNQPPTVSAGADQTLNFFLTAQLRGNASDDGQVGPLSLVWSKVSGPGSVTFANAASAATAATFSQPGAYVLRLSANDGALSATDETMVTLVGENQPPTVDAGADQEIALGSPSALAAVVGDDGLPASGTLSLTWSKISGPGTVSFGNVSAASTTVTFSGEGLYQLQLTVTDGEFTVSDRVEVNVDCATLASPPGLVGFWKGEDNVRDSMAKNVGTLLNGTTFTAGLVDRAFLLDGTNDDIAITASTSTNVGTSPGFTVECWVRPTLLNGLRPIAEWGQTGTGVHFFASVSTTGTLYANIVDTNGVNHAFSAPANTLLTGVWQHVALTYSKTTGVGRIYKNGAIVAQATLGVFTPRTIADLHIGARSTFVWSGALDEVSLYNRDLTGTEVQSIHAAGACGKADGLPAEYPLLAVRAGADQTIGWPQSAALAGTLIDRRSGSDAPSIEWTKLSGPGNVYLPLSNSLSGPAFFSEPGTYVLRLSARAGDLEAFDDLAVEVSQNSFRHTLRLKSGNGTANDPLNRYTTNGGATWLPTLLTGNSAYALLPGTSYITGQFVQFSSARIRARWVFPAAYTNPALNIQYYADNSIRVHLNGTQFAQTPAGLTTAELQNYSGGAAFAAPASNVTVSTPSMFHGGENYVELENFNSFGPMGVDYVAEVSYDAPGVPGNIPPQVSAGPDRIVTLPSQIALAGTVSDDGLALPDYIETIWEVVSGPGAAAFSNPRVLNPTVTVNTAGNYVFSLTARDGEYTVVDTVSATVFPNTGPNSAPVVEAGPDFSGADSNSIPLVGFISDDGRPLATPAVAWRKVSGPGAVGFGNEHATVTDVVFALPGTYVLELSATDGLLSGSDTVTAQVQPSGWTNAAPSVSAGADRTLQLPQGEVILSGSAADDGFPEGRSLTYRWEFVSSPGAATLTEPTAKTVIAQFLDAGLYILRFTASDGLLNSSDEVAITVLPVPNPDPGNAAPVVHAGSDQLVPGLGPVTLAGTVSDDGLPAPASLSVQWAKVSGPGVVSFSAPQSANTQVSFNYPGAYVLRLSARDGQATASDDIQLTVGTGGNQPPTANAGPDRTTNYGQSITLVPQFTDDGLPTGFVTLAWTVISGPGMVHFAGTADELTVSFDKVGSYTLRLTVDDDQLNASDDVVVTVAPGNLAAPTVALTSPIDGQLLAFGQSVPLAATADAPGVGIDFVDFYADGAFLGRDGAAPFSFVWTPPTSGPHSVTARAFDELGVSAESASVEITVGPPAPKVSLTYPAAYSAFAPGQPLAVQATASAAPGGAPITGVEFLLNGSVIGIDTTAPYSVSTITPTALGDHTLTARATDGNNETATSAPVLFRVAADPTGPLVAQFDPALDGSSITAPSPIIGTVGGPTMREYTVEYRQIAADCNQWTTFGIGSQTVTNGTLATLDPTLLPNGIYELRLITRGAHSVAALDLATVVVEGEMKVGDLELSFTDLNVRVGGMSLALNRLYDSKQKCAGDFGIGWNLDVNAVRLSKNRRLGEAWVHDILYPPGCSPFSLDPACLPGYCMGEEAPHIIAITFPNGRVHRFRPTIRLKSNGSDACRLVAPWRFFNEFEMVFEALPGSEGTLIARDIPASLYPLDDFLGTVTWMDQNIVDFPDTAEPFVDAKNFEYTGRDGRTYVFDAAGELSRMTDTNGNSLTITDDGIFHSSGKSLTWTRDGEGRIATVTDPKGQSMNYIYSLAGDLIKVIDRASQEIGYTYDSAHRLLKQTNPAGDQPFRNEFDGSGRLVRHVDVYGKTVTYTRNIGARTETIVNRLGEGTTVEYDERGNVLRRVNALGEEVKATFDPDGRKLTETDPLGKTRHFTYAGPNGELTRIVDAMGNAHQFEYNDDGVVTALIEPRGAITDFAYDARGNLLRAEDTLGHPLSYTYDAFGRVASSTDALGNITTSTYDASGNLETTTDANSHQSRFEYDANNNLVRQVTTRTTAQGVQQVVSEWVYDELDRLVEVVEPDGGRVQLHYDANGRDIGRTNALGRRTTHEYDAIGRRIKTIHADGLFETWEYDAEDRQIAHTDRSGRTKRVEYDGAGRKTKVINADETSITMEYNAAGRMVASVDARGKRTTYTYDDVGRRTSVTNPRNETTHFEYDAAGNYTSATDALDRTTTFTYDARNLLTKITHPDGTTEQTGYDELRRKISYTDQAGKTTKYEYDSMNRLTMVTDALEHQTKYTYDELGNQTAQTDALNRSTTFAYDVMGRRIKRTLPMGMSEAMQYDVGGNLVSRLDFNGRTTGFVYDILDRLTQKLPDPSLNQPTVLFTYTATSQRASMTDASGLSTYGYDEMDRLVTKTNPQGTLEYTYDEAGNLTQLRSTREDGIETNYEYDDLSRLKKVIDRELGATNYGYDAVGNLSSYVLPNGMASGYSYDTLNRLIEMVTDVNPSTGPPAEVARFVYSLNATGNRAQIQESGLGVQPNGTRTVGYAYDALRRLVQETVSGAVGGPSGQVGYTYDAVGNRLTRASTVTGLPSAGYGFDNNDRLLSDVSDANGNTIASDGKTDTYNFEDQLVRRQENGQTVEIVYDGDGNRVRERVTVGGITNEVAYLIDDLNPTGHAQVVEELTNGTLTRTYTYGHDLIAQDTREGTGQWRAQFFGYDGHGSVRYLSDELGQITDRYSYDAFGVELSRTGTTFNRYRYTGESFDDALGLYYLRARYYSASRGRFWTMDSHEGVTGDPATLHKYVYALNDPGNRVDPSGNFSLTELTTVQNIGGFARMATMQILKRLTMCKIKSIARGAVIGGLISGSIGGAISGVVSYVEGDTPSEIGKDILEGFTSGFLEGAIMGATANAGAVAFTIANVVTFARDAIETLRSLQDPSVPWQIKALQITNLMTQAVPFVSKTVRTKLKELLTKAFCFAEGTPVATAEGARPIEEITTGQLVWAANELTGARTLRRVVRTMCSVATALVLIDTGAAESIAATPSHPIWVEGQGMTAAANVRVGDHLQTRSGASVEVRSLEIRQGSFRVFNFEVEDAHTYFVGEIEALAHNACVMPTVTKNGHLITRSQARILPGNLKGGTGTTAAARAAMEAGDDAGHIIGRQLGGKGGITADNIFSQNPHINRGEYAQHENWIAEQVRAGHTVDVDIQLHYAPGSTRVDSISYDTYLDGVMQKTKYFGN